MRFQQLFDIRYQVIDIERFVNYVNALGDQKALLLTYHIKCCGANNDGD